MVAYCAETDVTSREAQRAAFQHAVQVFQNQIDFVAPVAELEKGVGVPSPNECEAMKEGEFEEPDLTVMDVDLRRVIYTIALVVQEFWRQEKDSEGWRGKIGVVAGVCSIHCVPTVPVKTAAKHGVTGFVRSYGNFCRRKASLLVLYAQILSRRALAVRSFTRRWRRKVGAYVVAVVLITVRAGLVACLSLLRGIGMCRDIEVNFTNTRYCSLKAYAWVKPYPALYRD